MPKQAGNRGRGNPAGRNQPSGGKSRGSQANQAAARARVAGMRAQEAARKRRRNWLAGIGAAVLVIIAAVAITLAVTSNSGGPGRAAASTPKLKLASLSTLGTLKPPPSPARTAPKASRSRPRRNSPRRPPVRTVARSTGSAAWRASSCCSTSTHT